MGRSSSKREEIYAFLKDYIASHGYPPTTREIMAGVGLRSTASVHYHLSELSRSGAIEMDGGKNRAISLGAEAAPQGVPLIGVAYDPKVTAFLDYVEQTNYMQFEAVNEEDLSDQIDAAVALAGRGEELRRRTELLNRQEDNNRATAARLLGKE